MAKSKRIYIPGPVHRCEVKLVTPRYLSTTFADSGEKIAGCYDDKSNKIYLDKTLQPEAMIHTFIHEVYHMFRHQMETFDEEQAADAYATFAINFYKVADINHLLGMK